MENNGACPHHVMMEVWRSVWHTNFWPLCADLAVCMEAGTPPDDDWPNMLPCLYCISSCWLRMQAPVFATLPVHGMGRPEAKVEHGTDIQLFVTIVIFCAGAGAGHGAPHGASEIHIWAWHKYLGNLLPELQSPCRRRCMPRCRCTAWGRSQCATPVWRGRPSRSPRPSASQMLTGPLATSPSCAGARQSLCQVKQIDCATRRQTSAFPVILPMPRRSSRWQLAVQLSCVSVQL